MENISTCELIAVILVSVEAVLYLIGALVNRFAPVVSLVSVILGSLSWVASFVLMFFIPGGQYNLFDGFMSLLMGNAFNLDLLKMVLAWILVFLFPASLAAYLGSRS